MQKISLFILLILSQAAIASGQIMQVKFQENEVVPIIGTLLTTTQIVFGAGEEVLDAQGGDSQSWVLTHQKSLPNMLFLKPTNMESNTNMTVTTNKHTYYFHLISSANANPTYALKFVYPNNSKNTPSLLKNPKQLHTEYTYNGTNLLKPKKVFDDGVFTYIELYPNQPVPAVFAVEAKDGSESIVNISRQKNTLVIHQTAPQFTLRLNNQAASLFNQRTIAFIKEKV